MSKQDFVIRLVKEEEIDKVSEIISTGYYHDKFFKWSVENDEERHQVVADYYKVYLRAKGCVAHVAESTTLGIIGASVWLPHDTEEKVYDEIDIVTGVYSPQFRAVADNSHDSEPPVTPFYQLVGVVVVKEAQGMGVGGALLEHNLNAFDKQGIPTYLEASTAYYGGGVYGKFGYQLVGELMEFRKDAVLYPCWRFVNGKPRELEFKNTNKERSPHQFTDDTVSFGGSNWHVLASDDDKLLLLSEQIVALGKYHDKYENITWEKSTVRQYLNGDFYATFSPEEQRNIVETYVENSNNTWFHANAGVNTKDKIFLLSLEEVAKYLGDSGQIHNGNPNSQFFVDDEFNHLRKGICSDGEPTRWFLRTSGNAESFVATVTIEGKISMTGDFVNRSSSHLFNVGIRPVMWVKKNSIK